MPLSNRLKAKANFLLFKWDFITRTYFLCLDTLIEEGESKREEIEGEAADEEQKEEKKEEGKKEDGESQKGTEVLIHSEANTMCLSNHIHAEDPFEVQNIYCRFFFSLSEVHDVSPNTFLEFEKHASHRIYEEKLLLDVNCS